ncbi:golgin candidate 5-like [Miscanthus floridulus]|uniref:golgin candidate 5-like n=1 Tax=Miscanthus floridulus TaxID=154761 RepID=UPI003457852B
MEVPALAPRKALKVSASSTAQWVMEAQTAIQRGMASARADPKEPDAQEEAAEVATEQAEEEEPTPREAEAHESAGAEAPSVAEATEVEAPRTSEAEATEAGVSGTTEAAVAEVGAPETTEAGAVEAGMSAVKPAAQEVETGVGQASILPPVQGPPPSRESAREVEVHSISSDDTSREKGVADAEAASAMEQPALTSGEGSSALVRVQPEPHWWDHLRVLWRSRDDPEGEPLFALEDAAEGGRWDTFEQYHQLVERSLQTALSVVADDLPGVTQELEAWSLRKSIFLRWERDVWDQLQRQKGLLAHANELLSARSAKLEDLRLRCADMRVKVVMAQEQVAPLAARVKELEEELTRLAGDRDAFRSWAEEATASVKALAGQLGAEQGVHRLAKGALAEALKVAEASRTEALVWKGKAEELGKEASREAEASRVEVQGWKEKAKASRVEA